MSSCLLNISFISLGKIKKLNLKWRNIAFPTNVLSFSSQEKVICFKNSIFLGDIIVCIEYIKGKSFYFKHSLSQEISILVMHAVLHLFGINHEKKTNEIIKKIQYEMVMLNLLDFKNKELLICRNSSILY